MIKMIQSKKRQSEFWTTLPKRTFDEVGTDNYDALLVVDTKRTYQTHMGFGGAFSEAAAHVFAKTPHQEEALNAYFSEEGLKYNLGRTVIHSSDFSVASRTYINEGDETLDSFDLSFDDEAIVPLIQRASKKAGGLWLFASPWSPPAFMKTNQNLYYGGSLKPEYYTLWAQYIIKYLKAMLDRGITISALSIQNEPAANQTWESCHYTVEEESKMVEVLYDALQEAKLDVKLIIWDHNRDVYVERAHGVLKHAKDKVWGVGHHWYVSEDSQNLSVIHDLYPDTHILFTEGCVELTNPAFSFGDQAEDLWKHGEHYGRNIIKDSLNYTEGFVEWNLFLDDQGGPNHVQNYCEAPIMIDRQTGALTHNPSYYYIGHFSRHIQPGAKRVHIQRSVHPTIYATAYQNPSGEIVVVIQNEGWLQNITLYVDQKPLNVSLPDRSITTFVISNKA